MDRRLAAVLAADVAGYTKRMEQDSAGTVTAWQGARDEVISHTVTEYSGRIVKFTGDGFLAEFPTVQDAVSCAISMQKDLATNSLDFRMGINLGDIIDDGTDIHGEGVNVAARIEALAKSGGICISGSVHEQVRHQLNYPFEDMGEIRVKNVSEPVRVVRILSDGETPQRLNRLRTKLPGFSLLALAIAVAALVGWLLSPSLGPIDSERPPSLGSPRLSIAVLPFANSSGDKDQDYFADALTDDLTSDLSRISGSFVISRSTAATYKGREIDARQVAQELNVHYLLEGTVRKSRDTVLVNARLTDGETGQQVWSERYEKTGGDIYTFQNDVTGRIARTLNLELKNAQSRQVVRGGADNLDSADLTLRAWAELWTKPQSRATNKEALTYVSEALKLDPKNAEANGVAAYAYARAATYGWGMSRAEAIKLGIAAGQRSVSLDLKNADAAYALGFLYYLEGDTRKSLEQMRQCISLNRNHAPAYFFHGLNLIRLGRAGDAISWVERAFKLSPRDPLRSVWYGTIGRAQVLLADDAQAVETANKGIAANPKHPHNYAVLASAYAHLGNMDGAQKALEGFLHRQPGMTITRHWRNVASDDQTAMKSYERLIAGLRKAGLPD
jgi:adenylate cyclase